MGNLIYDVMTMDNMPRNTENQDQDQDQDQDQNQDQDQKEICGICLLILSKDSVACTTCRKQIHKKCLEKYKKDICVYCRDKHGYGHKYEHAKHTEHTQVKCLM
jgi:hypothetical protein